MIPITASVSNTGFAHTAAAGNKYKPNRRNPYVPIFSNTPAKMTEPPVGACVCASGNQVCSGKIGTFTANAMAKDTNSQRPVLVAKLACSAIVTKSKVRYPMSRRARTAVAMMPTNMNAEPSIVYKKNFVAAYTRLSYPHPPMRKYIGTRTISKKMKNKKRSRLRKLPITPASSNNNHAK